jgi:phage terminase large subunit
VNLQTTAVFEANAEAWRTGKRRAINQGGTYSSKTWSVLQLLILIAQHAKKPLLISVVSESLPHLRKGCIRDLQAIMGPDFRDDNYNKSEQTYSFPNGSIIEFFGADESGKVRGPRRDILFINEANNVPWETVRGLDVRTRRFTVIDYNPVSEFWAHEYWIGQPENAYIHSTYRDALEVVPAEVIENIIATGERDPNWANIYLDGKVGKVEALVYPSFSQVPVMPENLQIVYGLDFGYSNDPTVLVRCGIRGDELYCQELIFEAGLTNDMIARRMDEAGVKRRHEKIWADAAEPKSIDEIRRYGFDVEAAPKGADSVEYGHQRVRQYKHFWTADSVESIKEQRNFRYLPDRDGKLTNRTTHNFSHAMDARRYAVVGLTAGQRQFMVG